MAIDAVRMRGLGLWKEGRDVVWPIGNGGLETVARSRLLSEFGNRLYEYQIHGATPSTLAQDIAI